MAARVVQSEKGVTSRTNPALLVTPLPVVLPETVNGELKCVGSSLNGTWKLEGWRSRDLAKSASLVDVDDATATRVAGNTTINKPDCQPHFTFCHDNNPCVCLMYIASQSTLLKRVLTRPRCSFVAHFQARPFTCRPSLLAAYNMPQAPKITSVDALPANEAKWYAADPRAPHHCTLGHRLSAALVRPDC